MTYQRSGEIGPQLPLFEIREIRDAALKQVLENSGSWSKDALSCVHSMLPELPAEFTSEVIRRRVEREVGLPHHHNAWGALINSIAGKRWIVPVEGTKKSRARAAKGRKLQRYTKGELCLSMSPKGTSIAP